ncbi:MAG: S8 family serine peptidase, partial [Planctomycetes bacterium]|nr:S8 family serine peptidase [Planctomycetota bacterium]
MHRLIPRLLALAAVLHLTAASVTTQTPSRDPAELELARTISRSPQAIGDHLCVKLREGSGAELVSGVLRSRTGFDLAGVNTLFGMARAEPLFTVMSWDELDLWHRRACANLPVDNRPGHLGLWFRLVTPTVEQADWLFERLWAEPMVEHVVKEPRGTPAGMPMRRRRSMPTDIPPPTPLFTSLQGTFEPTPLGHSIWRGQGVLGARGQGVRVEMIELEWDLDHEDVSQCVAANFVGAIPTPGGQAGHGTAGASIVSADRNEYGFTGIADEVAMRFYPTNSNGGIANTILTAGANCQVGDVLMMVMMYMLGQNGGADWVPYEIVQPIFDASLTVTGNGRVMVVSAGNGDNNLDDPRLVRRFDRSYRDSGVLIVSASDGSLLPKAPFANFGSCIDAHSWGDDVCVCGVPTLFFPNNDIRQAYSADGTGTSSAVPAIAGIAAALQGASAQQLG